MQQIHIKEDVQIFVQTMLKADLLCCTVHVILSTCCMYKIQFSYDKHNFCGFFLSDCCVYKISKSSLQQGNTKYKRVFIHVICIWFI